MIKSKNIVFINQATGYLTIDIINEFVYTGKFANIDLIAGSIRVQDIALDEKVNWSRIAIYDRGGPRKKMLSWLKGTIQIFWLLLTKYRKYDIFYVTIPPIAYFISLFVGNKFSVLIFDVYPDALKVYNVSSKNLFYKIWVKINRVIFKKAHKIYTIGEGMSRLLQAYVDKSQITVIKNWTGLTGLKNIDESNNFFIQEQGLQDKFVVMYSGNIGVTHNVEVLIEIAGLLNNHEDVFFLIIGRGDRYRAIEHLINTSELSNCRLLPFQADNLLNYTLSASDLGVVLLDNLSASVSVPSKIYNLQALGIPIIGIADTNSDLANHLNSYKNGRCINSSDKQKIADYIVQLKDDNQEYMRLKENSLTASLNFTIKNAKMYVSNYV